LKNLQELRAEGAEIIAKLDAMLKAADDESRDLSDDETNEWETLEARHEEVKSEIAKQETMEGRKAKIAAEKAELEKSATPDERKIVTATVHNNAEDEEFRNFGEFVGAVYRAGKGDVDVRVQQMKNGTSGGFLIPDKFISTIFAVEPEEAVVGSRATMLSNEVPPDAEAKAPALDQGTNDYGGVVITHGGESDQMTETNATFRQIALKPHKLTALTYVSNEMINNAAGFSGFMQGLLRGAMVDATETDYIEGNGVNKALGFLNAPSRIDVARTTANQIAFADVTAMLARRLLRGPGNWVWLASQSILPQLTGIGDGTNNIYVTNAAAPVPQTLMGLPLIYNDRFPGLGTRGDLCLVDLSKYLIANGSGPSLMVSDQFRFDRDEIALRLTFRTDGQSWLNNAITPKGSTDTRSPFVILQ
jgi:HK97 family phage major capsid protein